MPHTPKSAIKTPIRLLPQHLFPIADHTTETPIQPQREDAKKALLKKFKNMKVKLVTGLQTLRWNPDTFSSSACNLS
jgi:hypothetical protein